MSLAEYKPWEEIAEVTVTLPGALMRYGVEGVTLPYVYAADAQALVATASLIGTFNLVRLAEAGYLTDNFLD